MLTERPQLAEPVVRRIVVGADVPVAAGRAVLWARGDLLIAAALAVLTALSRWPFRSRMIYAWDGGLFARALRDYNVVPHFPQPPGYIFYVATAKGVQGLTGLGANDTYVAISVAAAALTVAALHLLGTAMFGRTVGLLSAGLGLTSVSFWFFSEIAYPYTVLALGSTALALLCWLLCHGWLRRPPLAALAFGLVAGFRQDLLIFLGPLFAVCYLAAIRSEKLEVRSENRTEVGARLRPSPAHFSLRTSHRSLRIVQGLLLGAAGIAAWWLATDLASEGPGSLWRALTVQSSNVERGTSAFATGATGLRSNLTLLGWFSKDALHLGVFPALAYATLWPTQPRREGWRPVFLLLWMLPAIGFYLLVHIGEAGYVFSFLPAVLIAAGAGIARLADALVENLPRPVAAGRRAVLRVAMIVALAGMILAYHSWLFVGSARLVSAERLACKDEAIGRAVATIAAGYPPPTTEVVTSTYLQHLAIYLPQYPHVRFLDPDRDAAWAAPPGIERVVVFDLELVQRVPAAQRGAWTLVPLACAGRYDLAVVPAAGARFTFDAASFRLEVAR